MTNTITRENIKTIGIWSLERRDFGQEGYYYSIKVEGGRKPIDLFVNEHPDSQTGRTAFTVEYSHPSNNMDLEEAAEFIEQAKQVLEIAVAFQQAIDSREGILNPEI